MKAEPKGESKVIALDYYDGAIEGFGQQVLGESDCYFRLIAWDSDQNERLYGVVKTDAFVYQRVKLLLGKAQEVSNLLVWVPRWEFVDANDEKEAEDIVVSCRERMYREGYLLLARDIHEQPTEVVTITGELVSKVRSAVVRGAPEELILWREHLRG